MAVAACMVAGGIAGVVLSGENRVRGFLSGSLAGAVFGALVFSTLLPHGTRDRVKYYSETSALYRQSGSIDLT